MGIKKTIPVVLFAYARPDYLRRTLTSLREDKIPLLHVFSDGPKTPDVADAVNEVRNILHTIDWCEMHIVERTENLGLGRSIITGVTEVLDGYEAIIVFEDDLICIPGTYQYLRSALEHYRDTPNVMSVTGWTHPRVTPDNINGQPYFDGRTECLAWGTWKRAWSGMDQDSLVLIDKCKRQSIDIYRYGADLVEMAQDERKKNIWGVRFSFWHILNKGICLRPPYSLVQHIGYGAESVNVKSIEEYGWHVDLPEYCPPIPKKWPAPIENPICPKLWQKALGQGPSLYKKIIQTNSFHFITNSIIAKSVIYVLRRLKKILAFVSRSFWKSNPPLANRLPSMWNKIIRPIRWGNLRRLKPISRVFGFDRGTPIDRYYIESFLKKYQADIHGCVLEIGDPEYTNKFGGERVTRSEVLHAVSGNPQATIVGDLASGEGIPLEAFDCIILVQTLNVIYETKNTIANCFRALKPGGSLLVTFPGISQISRYDMDRWGDYWRFTDASAKRLFGDVFGVNNVTVETFGNVLVACSFLQGLSSHDLNKDELDYPDPDYQVLISVRAIKKA